MRYVTNAAVVTLPGTYRYRRITPHEARTWLERPGWRSFLGYYELAQALKEILRVDVPVNKRTVDMEVGDEALVARLSFPAGTRRLTRAVKGELGEDFLAKHLRFGILNRIA